MPNSPLISSVLETVLYYSDQDRTEKFYSDVLGMRLLGQEPGRSLFYRVGSRGDVLLLFNADVTRNPDRSPPPHGATGSIHTCFRVPEGEYERWKAYLPTRGVAILNEVKWERGLSFYFHDPDGNVLEIANADIWKP